MNAARDRGRASPGGPPQRQRHQRQLDADARRRERGRHLPERLTDTNPKFIVLATDGQPNCPAQRQHSRRRLRWRRRRGHGREERRHPDVRRRHRRRRRSAEMALNMMAVEGGYPQDGRSRRSTTRSRARPSSPRCCGRWSAMATTCTFSVPPPPTNDGTTSREDIARHGRHTARRRHGDPAGRQQRLDLQRRQHDVDRAARNGVRSGDGGDDHDRHDRLPLPPHVSAFRRISRLRHPTRGLGPRRLSTLVRGP